MTENKLSLQVICKDFVFLVFFNDSTKTKSNNTNAVVLSSHFNKTWMKSWENNVNLEVTVTASKMWQKGFVYVVSFFVPAPKETPHEAWKCLGQSIRPSRSPISLRHKACTILHLWWMKNLLRGQLGPSFFFLLDILQLQKC